MMKNYRTSSTLGRRLILCGALVLVFFSTNVFAASEAQSADVKVLPEVKPFSFPSLYAQVDLSTSTDASRLLGVNPTSTDNVATDAGKVSQEDPTGTDPSAFGNKFMPYYRYTKLENGLEINQYTLFGMFAINANHLWMYELPVANNVDFGGVKGFESLGDNSGMGDLTLRYLWKPRTWTGTYPGSEKKWTFMPTFEATLPTATDDMLGGETTTLSTGITWVTDLPGPPPIGIGFIAFMNLLDFDVDKGRGESDVLRYRGRWFWMQPLSRPGPSLGDGLYVLTELQPVYDFVTDDFDVYVAPEFGKIIRDGLIIYGKPGWGMDREVEDREFTLEFGIRYFF